MLNKRVKAGKFGKDAEKMIGNRSAGEIVDEPAEFGVDLHPLQEANDVRLGEVVGKERADDEVNRLFGPPAKDVSRDPANCAPRWAGLGGDGDGVGVTLGTATQPAKSSATRPTVASRRTDVMLGAKIMRRPPGLWRSLTLRTGKALPG